MIGISSRVFVLMVILVTSVGCASTKNAGTKSASPDILYVANQGEATVAVVDMATNEVIVVPNASINKTVKIGTIMPEGLTTLLTRNELRDLVAYLLTLKN